MKEWNEFTGRRKIGFNKKGCQKQNNVVSHAQIYTHHRYASLYSTKNSQKFSPSRSWMEFFVLFVCVICVSLIEVLWTIALCEWRKGKFSPAHSRKRIHLEDLLISPPSLAPWPRLFIYPPLFPLARLLMSTLPTDPSPGCPFEGTRFLPRLQGTTRLRLQPAPEKEKRSVTRYE